MQLWCEYPSQVHMLTTWSPAGDTILEYQESLGSGV